MFCILFDRKINTANKKTTTLQNSEEVLDYVSFVKGDPATTSKAITRALRDPEILVTFASPDNICIKVKKGYSVLKSQYP